MSTPIVGLDHVTVLTADLDRAIADYELLLGCRVAWRSSGDGAATALFTLPNMSLELMAPAGEGDDGARVRAALETLVSRLRITATFASRSHGHSET